MINEFIDRDRLLTKKIALTGISCSSVEVITTEILRTTPQSCHPVWNILFTDED